MPPWVAKTYLTLFGRWVRLLSPTPSSNGKHLSDKALDTLKTPLNGIVRRAGAKMVNFAGWDMPVQFRSVVEEHLAVRNHAGLFDVSHMGEILVKGKDAFDCVQYLTPNNVARLSPGQVQYSALLTPRGTFVDDILVYRRGEADFLLCVNASNIQKDYQWIQSQARGEVEVEDASSRFAQLALQGPKAAGILAEVADPRLADLPSYHFVEGKVGGISALISRTGYTGEDGFEIYLAPEGAEQVWSDLLRVGATEGLQPAGLAARDTLRLEARLPLYGNDIDDTVTPLEAGLSFMVRLDSGDFLGAEVLREQKTAGISRKLAGFELTDRGIARHGHSVRVEGREVGEVTSGTFAPFLKRSIGLAYLPAAQFELGKELEIVIREKRVRGKVVKTPFYKRKK